MIPCITVLKILFINYLIVKIKHLGLNNIRNFIMIFYDIYSLAISQSLSLIIYVIILRFVNNPLTICICESEIKQHGRQD